MGLKMCHDESGDWPLVKRIVVVHLKPLTIVNYKVPGVPGISPLKSFAHITLEVSEVRVEKAQKEATHRLRTYAVHMPLKNSEEM